MEAEKSKIILVAFLAFLICLPFIFTTLSAFNFIYDEGSILVLSETVLHGKIPYRDFDYPYPPVQLYVNAAVLAVSKSIPLLHFVCAIFVVIGAIGIFKLGRLIIDGNSALIPPLLYTLYMFPVFNTAVPDILVNMFLVWAGYSYLKRRYLLAGILAVLCIFTKHNVGVFLVVGMLLHMVIFMGKRAWKPIVRTLLPVLIIGISYLVYLVTSNSLSRFIFILLILPLTLRHLTPFLWSAPFVSFHLTLFNLAQCFLRVLYIAPIIIYLAYLYENRKSRIPFFIGLLCLISFQQFFPNLDVGHFAWGFAPSFIILVALARRKSLILKGLFSLLILAYILLGLYAIHFYQTSPLMNTEMLKTGTMKYALVQPQTAKTLAAISGTIGNSSIFVFGCEAMIYYMTDKPVPSPVIWFYQGNYSTPALQGRIIGGLKQASPQWVIVNDASNYTHVYYPLVWEYVNRNYIYNKTIPSEIGGFEFYNKVS